MMGKNELQNVIIKPKKLEVRLKDGYTWNY